MKPGDVHDHGQHLSFCHHSTSPHSSPRLPCQTIPVTPVQQSSQRMPSVNPYLSQATIYNPKSDRHCLAPAEGADLTSAVAAYYSGSAADNTSSSHTSAHHSHSTRSTGGGGAHDTPETYPYLSNGGGGATPLSQSQSPSYRSLSSHLPPGQPLTHQQPPLSSQSQLNSSPSNQSLSSQYPPPHQSHQSFTSQQHHQPSSTQHHPPMSGLPPSHGSPDPLPRLRHSIMTARPASLSEMRVPPHVGLGGSGAGQELSWGGLPVPSLYRSGSSGMPEEETGGSPMLSPGHASWGQQGQVCVRVGGTARVLCGVEECAAAVSV